MKRCVALFHHGWADWEAGFILPALREYFGFEVRIASPGGADVVSIGGVKAAADLAFEAVEVGALDVLLVIGSDSWTGPESPEVSALLRAADGSAKVIGAICAGTLAVARAGLLDDRPHTSNAPEFLKAEASGYRGEGLYRAVPRAVTGGNVVTSPGSAPGTFSVAVLRLAVPDQDAMIDQYATMLAAEYAA